MQGHRRAPRALSGGLLTLLAALPCACASSAGGLVDREARIQPEHGSVFLALEGALSDGEDELAARLLDTLADRPLTSFERRTLDAYASVLRGRQLVRRLHLALEYRDAGERPQLVLVVRSDAEEPLTLAFPPASLHATLRVLDAEGRESRQEREGLVHPLAALPLAPGETVAISLGGPGAALDAGGGLARRDIWRMEFRAGEVRTADGRYPAAGLRALDCERLTLAPGLLQASVSAPDFLDSVASALASPPADGEDAGLQLLALAVQLDPSQREAALRGLDRLFAPHRAQLPGQRGPSLAALAPALQWVAGTREPGGSAGAWARWLETWVERADDRGGRSGLVLPSR